MKKSKKEKDDLRLKIQFYVLSLWLLFVLIFLLSVNIPISFDKEAEFIGFWPLIQRNWLAIISLAMVFVGIIISFKLKHKFKGVRLRFFLIYLI